MSAITMIGESNNLQAIENIIQISHEKVQSQEKQPKVEEKKHFEQGQSIDVFLEKYRLVSSVHTDKSSEEDPSATISQIKKGINENNIDDIIDKNYLEDKLKNFYYELVETEKGISGDSEVTREMLESKAKTLLENLSDGNDNKMIENQLKHLLSSVDTFPEKQKIDLFKSILLHGILINATQMDNK
ncbi:MAG: hypothetical protein AB1633_13845 [Elusimicrobiota bacterium]